MFSCVMLVILSSAPTLPQDGTVEFEVFTDGGLPVTTQQRWLKMLQDLDLRSLRIRGGRLGDEAKIEIRGTERSPAYRVTARLTEANTLVVPGTRFRYGDRKQLATWVETLKRDGPESLTEPTGAFGLTEKQLLVVHDGFKLSVTFDTRGRRTAEIVNQLMRRSGLEFVIDPGARGALATADPVADELKGLSCGTALAAALRPLGLVMVPIAERRMTKVKISTAEGVADYWPVGWPPDKALGRFAPDLMKFVEVEINDTSLAESLSNIQPRVGLPFLMDHNSLAYEEIDPNSAQPTIAKTRTFYKKVIDSLLYQVKLKAELRADEAKRPFLWITTIKNVQRK